MNEEEAEAHYINTMNLLQHSADESDRGRTLIIAAFIEDFLRKLIESFLIESREVLQLFEGPYAPFGSLSGKTRAAYLMGLITKDEMKKIDSIRSVRNVYAHYFDASFEHEKIKKICVKPPIFDGRLCDRDAFFHMALNTVTQILHRDLKWIEKRKELE